MLKLYLSAHLLKTHEMKINRPCANSTAAWKRYLRLPASDNQRAKDKDRRPHCLNKVIRGIVFDKRLCIYAYGIILLNTLNLCAKITDEFPHCSNIHKLRDIVNNTLRLRKKGGSHYRKRRILCAADFHLTL